MELLSCRDLCNASLACKGLSEWVNSFSFLEGAARVQSGQSLASLLRFQRRRAPLGLMVSLPSTHLSIGSTKLAGSLLLTAARAKVRFDLQVETLHFYYHPRRIASLAWDKVALDKAMALDETMRGNLLLNLQLCSATLTELYLEPLYLIAWVDELKVCVKARTCG